MEKLKYVNANVDFSELTDAGRMVIEAAKRQNWSLRNRLDPKNGQCEIILWDICSDSSDVISVKVESTISYRERWLQYGNGNVFVDMKKYCSHMGKYGLPIPNEDFIRIEERMIGKNPKKEFRFLSIPSYLIEAFGRGKISGAEAINQFGDEVNRFCEEGHWQPA